MTFTRTFWAAGIALAVAMGGGSAAFSKAHDQGVADGSCGTDRCATNNTLTPGIVNHNTYQLFVPGGRGSIVSGVDTPGLGSAKKNPDICTSPMGLPTCGVAATGDLTYGQNVVGPRVEAGLNGINGGQGPVTNDSAPGQNK